MVLLSAAPGRAQNSLFGLSHPLAEGLALPLNLLLPSLLAFSDLRGGGGVEVLFLFRRL